MTINEYQTSAMRTSSCIDEATTPEWAQKLVDLGVFAREDLLLLNGALGLTGEAGECADIVKKGFFHGHEIDRLHLAKELGDVAWYLAVTATALGYDLEEILQMNINKLSARYPERFSVERSLHRAKGDI